MKIGLNGHASVQIKSTPPQKSYNSKDPLIIKQLRNFSTPSRKICNFLNLPQTGLHKLLPLLLGWHWPTPNLIKQSLNLRLMNTMKKPLSVTNIKPAIIFFGEYLSTKIDRSCNISHRLGKWGYLSDRFFNFH